MKSSVIAIFAALAAVNALVWLWAWHSLASSPALLATALLAYVLGLRHAVDADHIAAIDNVVRKLMQDGRKPLLTGFYFSLGHSTVVVLAAFAIAVATTAMQARLEYFKFVGGVVGTIVSAVFLLAIGVANLVILKSVWKVFRRAERGEDIEPGHLDMMVSGGGFIARLCRPLFQTVSRTWHMYPVGFLFGLGFDTATEISLLGISAAQASKGLSVGAIMVFPALFTAGMALVDTMDSVLMTGAYGWAFVHPVRKLWYNLTITAASVAVAVFIGGIEAIGLLVDKLRLEGTVWTFIAALNDRLDNVGFVVIGLFVTCWLLSIVIYRWRGYDNLIAYDKSRAV
jgi:nickel/cobalt transporter (NiCoT) family protein